MRARFFPRSYPPGPLRVAFGAAERGARIEIPRRAASENVRYGSAVKGVARTRRVGFEQCRLPSAMQSSEVTQVFVFNWNNFRIM